MRAIVYGSGDVSEKNVAALLDDFMSVRTRITCSINTAGSGPAVDFTQRWGIENDQVITPYGSLDDAMAWPTSVILLATSPEHPEELEEALICDCLVMDFCHGLFPLS